MSAYNQTVKWLETQVDGKIITDIHLWYLSRMDKTRRVYHKGQSLPDEVKTKIIKQIIPWLKSQYVKTGKAVGSERIQAKIRSDILTELGIILPDLTDVPWASIWYPEKRIESIRHIVEDGSQLGTYKRDLLKMTRDTRVSSFHMSIAFNLIRLLSRNYNEGNQKFERFRIIDPCCGMGIRVITALLMEHDCFGYDVSPSTINKVKSIYPDYSDNFFVNNSTLLIPHDDNSIDLVFTCPPYWNIEKYQDIDGQLSSYKKYDDFLNNYAKLINESVRVSNKYIVFVVSNFRSRKRYYDFYHDTQMLFDNHQVELSDKIILGRDLSKPTGGTKSIIHNHTRSAHDEMLIYKKIFKE